MTVRILSPIGRPPAPTDVPQVARLNALEGSTLGLLDNSKKNADALLDAVSAGLLRDHRSLDVRWWQKGEGTGAAGAAPEATLVEMSRSVDAALVALGD